MNRYLVGVLCLLALTSVLSSISEARTRESYIRLRISNAGELHELTRLVSIDQVDGTVVKAYATDEMLASLARNGYRWTVLPNPGDVAEVRMASSVAELQSDWASYPTYPEYVEMMETFAAQYPDLCRLETIGETQEGRQLLVMRITDNPDVEKPEPEVFFTSTMHGDETVGYVLMLRLIDDLLSNYGKDAEITSLVNELDIWINPLANPDGTYARSDQSVRGAKRFLANGVDPNRNFPDPEDGDHPDRKPWAPETIHMMDFASAHSFILSVNFHGGSEVVNYPWDTMPKSHPDEDWFINISRHYADQVQADGPDGYMDGFDDGITNGYDWYEVNGGRQDYMAYWHGCREVTIELSMRKLAPPSSLPTFWDANHRAFLDYMENVFGGIHGIVTDMQGQPLAATIEVVGHDADNSQVYTDPDVGDYYRMLLGGVYTLQISADGYTPQLFEGITVKTGAATRVDAKLMP